MLYYIHVEQIILTNDEVVQKMIALQNMAPLEITGVVLCLGLIAFGLIMAAKL